MSEKNAECETLISVAELAKKLDCSERQIYCMTDRGAMPRPIKLGRLNRWLQSTIDAWLADKDAKANAKLLDTVPKQCAN